MKKIFITGTGTGVGKTLAAAVICQQLIELGFKVGYIKPIQTGCVVQNNRLLAPDEEFVKKNCGEELKSFSLLKFKLAASPHLAAQEEGVKINPEKLIAEIAEIEINNPFDYLLIEGAGGLAVPIANNYDMLDFCRALKAKLLVVASTTLGTLNHTKLTLYYAEQKKLEVVLVINRCSGVPEVIERDNIHFLQDMVEGRDLSEIPFIEGIDTEKYQRKIELPKISLNLSTLSYCKISK